MEGQSILGDRLTIGAHRVITTVTLCGESAQHHLLFFITILTLYSNSVTIISGWGVEGHLVGVIDENDLPPNTDYQQLQWLQCTLCFDIDCH